MSIAEKVHVNPEFTRIKKTVEWAEGYAQGIDICRENFPLIKPENRTRLPCVLCLGEGLLTKKVSILTNDKQKKVCIVWLEGLQICPECLGAGQERGAGST